ncbi:alpha-amylase family glycosyl hydrolase [Aquipuribacter hungaricus]|uniref:alpha-amylase family glycosyl hydrolase n=1 Tax=Aquipuribacter hungaricus TaxID=545624 RepID=UPI00361063F9
MAGRSPAGLWWHLHPLTFLGAEPQALPEGSPVVHRLPRLERWLDHVVALGCDGLLLGPVFASSSHGYDTVTYDLIDPRLGDADDLAHLVAAARERGVAVALDGVFNHVGRDFWAFRRVLAEGPTSPYASWFRLTWPADGWQGPGSEPAYETFEGHGALVALDHREPAVREAVSGVLERWAEVGVTAWRLDAAYAVAPGFLRAVTDAARAARPESLVPRRGHPRRLRRGRRRRGAGRRHPVPGCGRRRGAASSTATSGRLAHALGRHGGLTGDAEPQTFLGNHDVTRIASQVPDEALLPHAEVVLMTVAGVPSVYAGDEHGLHAVKEERAGGDDAIRPAFPEDPLALVPEVPGTFGRYRDLAQLRRAHPWLRTCTTEAGALANEHLVYTSRAAADGPGRLVVALSLHADPVDLEVPEGGWQVALGEAEVSPGRVRLPARGWAVLTEV